MPTPCYALERVIIFTCHAYAAAIDADMPGWPLLPPHFSTMMPCATIRQPAATLALRLRRCHTTLRRYDDYIY